MRSCLSARSSSLVIFASAFAFAFGVAACGGSAPKEEAKAPESDPWAGYSGKYTGPPDPNAPPETAKADPPKSDAPKSKGGSKAEAKEASKAAAPSAASTTSTTSATSKKRSTSSSTIQGESISLISPTELSTASKSAFQSKVVSSKLMVGPQYEQVQVDLKGASVQIIRPAQSPNPSGPAVSSPKTRNGALAATESGWYDEEADVLVVVSAGKKAGAQKVLGSILKH